jgi:hypothetical protein
MGYAIGTGLNNALAYDQPQWAAPVALPVAALRQPIPQLSTPAVATPVVAAPLAAPWIAPAIQYPSVPAHLTWQPVMLPSLTLPKPAKPNQLELNIATNSNWPDKGFTGSLAGEPFSLSYNWHFLSPDTITGAYANQPVSLDLTFPFLLGPHIQGVIAGKAVDVRVTPGFLTGRSLVGTFMDEPLSLEVPSPFFNDSHIRGTLGRAGIQITGQWATNPRKFNGTIGKATLKGALTGGWLQSYGFQGDLSSPVPIPKSYGALWLLLVMMRNIEYREGRYSHPPVVPF